MDVSEILPLLAWLLVPAAAWAIFHVAKRVRLRKVGAALQFAGIG
jgi:hypothetical protein